MEVGMIIEIRRGREAIIILVFALVGNRAEQLLICNFSIILCHIKHQCSSWRSKALPQRIQFSSCFQKSNWNSCSICIYMFIWHINYGMYLNTLNICQTKKQVVVIVITAWALFPAHFLQLVLHSWTLFACISILWGAPTWTFTWMQKGK